MPKLKMSLADKIKANKPEVPPHLIIKALAGCGKTTTLIEGLNYIKGRKPKIKPSPQQKKIWDQLKLSKDAQTICLSSFSNTIVDELKEKVPEDCEARTISSLGFQTVRNSFRLLPGKSSVNEDRVELILEEVTGMEIRELRSKYPAQVKTTLHLVDLCKLNLFSGEDESELDSLVDEFEMDLNGSRAKIYKMIPKILARCKLVDRDRFIDYTDMLWIPVVLRLPTPTFDLLLVDECFPAGTIVDTDKGKIPIESIADNPGEYNVLASADGGNTLSYSRVTSAYKTVRNNPLIKVTHEKGSFTCTANHPIWIEGKGWVAAGLISQNDCVRCLRKEETYKSQRSDLFEVVCSPKVEDRKYTREGSYQSGEDQTQSHRKTKVARKRKAKLVARELPLLYLQETDKTRQSFLLKLLCSTIQCEESRSCQRTNSETENLREDENSKDRNPKSDGSSGDPRQSVSRSEIERRPICNCEGRKRSSSNKPSATIIQGVEAFKAKLAMEPRVCCSTWKASSRVSNQLQSRYRESENESSCGVRRSKSSKFPNEIERCKERPKTEISRVVSVQILEPGSNSKSSCESEIDNKYVYTLSVEIGSYFADEILVKNCQDMSRAQQDLALRMGRRLVFCGDPNQAIYQFAGAASNSMKLLEDRLPNCIQLPLTVTRRCGKAIVEEAQRYVPEFEAHASNDPGKILYMKRKGEMLTGTDMSKGSIGDVMNKMLKGTVKGIDYRKQVEDGDMIICRVNAPLVSEVFKFIRQGRKANIRGRSIGDNLIKLVEKLRKKMEIDNCAEFGRVLQDWALTETQKETVKKFPNESKIQTIEDRRMCLETFCEEATTVDDIISKINAIFTDNTTTGILLSSVHRAKGLESNRVFFIQTTMRPDLTPTQIEAEHNIKYVGITRAIKELVFVT